MRFRKGSRVEVFSYKEVPYGAWRSAEIISGNGHTYGVRYYSFEVSNNEIVENRVPRKMIRPCPPQIDVDRWEVGELVEVLDHVSWKTATVLKELAGKYYVVRLLGAGSELTVHKANLRARQSWQDDTWVVIGKVSCSVKSSTLTGSDVHQNLKPILNNRVPKETGVASFRVLNAPCSWSECAESCTGSPKKIRSVEEGRHQHLFASSSVRKVDAAASGAVIKGGKICVQVFVNNNKSGFRQMVRVRSNRFSECAGKGSSVFNGCYDTDACSVGSCSPISYDESDTATSFLDRSSQAANACSGDAETSEGTFGCREEARWKHSLASGGEVRLRRPELYTYCITLEKLYASGPLNWEQEASLTDLRLSLSISTDEHLMELRNLKSDGTHSQFR